MTNSLKVGDRVRINGKGVDFNQNPDCMTPYIGKVFTVSRISDYEVGFLNGDGIHIKPSCHNLGYWTWRPEGVDKVSIPEGFIALDPETSHVSVKALQKGSVILQDGVVYIKNPVKKMTRAEIEKILGFEFEIVKGKNNE